MRIEYIHLGTASIAFYCSSTLEHYLLELRPPHATLYLVLHS